MAGGHGGRRPGAGRKFGSRQLYTVQKSVENATQFLRTNNIRVFEGDSVALMISVYKNEDLPLNIRLQCAMAVAPFERPRLVATANLHKNVDSDDANFAGYFSKSRRAWRCCRTPRGARSSTCCARKPKSPSESLHTVRIKFILRTVTRFPTVVNRSQQGQASTCYRAFCEQSLLTESEWAQLPADAPTRKSVESGNI